MSGGPQLPPDAIEAILKYLDLPPAEQLPLPPYEFLSTHIRILPASLLTPLSTLVPARQRSHIPLIKSRRLVYASQQPPPALLRADRGRLRWPLLWERLGGSSLPAPSSEVDEEESWVESDFNFHSVDGEPRQHVRKLGGFLRGLQEEREQEGVRAARRSERRLDDVGEEFDSDSDDEDERRRAVMHPGEGGAEIDHQLVAQAFERRLLELFVDGLDTIDYGPIDFTEHQSGDQLADRDEQEKYFDEEEPSRTSREPTEGRGSLAPRERPESAQNGSGEYDY